jgi:dimeric dUTPase (all-alpha-NTP-PPase superfamily)
MWKWEGDEMKQTKYDIIVIDHMLSAQRKFDQMALKNAGVDAKEVQFNMEIGLFVEAGEMINEIEKHWKHWKKNHRWNKKKVMDELADVLHLIFSRGVFLNVEGLHRHVITYADPVEHIREFAKSVVICGEDHHGWWTCFSLFRGLIEHLGIDWEEEMKDAYWTKHQINVQRQEKGY